MITAVDDAVTSTNETDDEARWAAAMSVLDRSPSPTAQQRLRRRRLLTWVFIVGAVLISTAAALLVVVVLMDRSGPDDDPAMWRDVSGLAFSAIGLLVIVVGGVIGWRAGVWKGVWSQPAAVLSRSQRKALMTQVRGHAPADPVRLPLARNVAERLVLQRHLLLFWVGILLQQVGRAITSTSPFDLGLVALTVLAFSLSAVLLGRDARRADRFLRRHPAPTADGEVAAG